MRRLGSSATTGLGTARLGRRLRRTPQSAGAGSWAPLIDVLFLLLIFLLVTANYDYRRVLEVNLPEASTATEAPRVSREQERVITLHDNGQLEWNGIETSLEELSAHLEKRPAEDRLLPVFIRSDAKVELGTGMRVLDELRRLGYHTYLFEVVPPRDATLPSETPSPAKN